MSACGAHDLPCKQSPLKPKAGGLSKFLPMSVDNDADGKLHHRSLRLELAKRMFISGPQRGKQPPVPSTIFSFHLRFCNISLYFRWYNDRVCVHARLWWGCAQYIEYKRESDSIYLRYAGRLSIFGRQDRHDWIFRSGHFGNSVANKIFEIFT